MGDRRCYEVLNGSSPRRVGVAVFVVGIALTHGCASHYSADANREVARVLADYEERVLAARHSWVKQPEPLTGDTEGADEATASAPAASANSPPAQPRLLDLHTALEIAFKSSRDFLDRKESLFLAGLGYTLTRYNFGPILNSTISYVWNDAEEAIGSDSIAANLGARQILPTGGQLSGSASLSGARSNNPDFLSPSPRFLYESSLQFSFRQPLLRGAGYKVSHEALTQGQRNLIYAVRSFELFRQSFSIQVAETYYRLVSQKKRLDNDEQNYADAVFDRQKAEALRRVDRNKDDDVFLARRREVEAEDALLVARTDFELAVDDFKILLGLPTSSAVQIADDEPPFEPVRIDRNSAVAVALENRLDLHTFRDRVEDSERQVRLARNGLLPDLDASLDYQVASSSGPVDDATPSRWSAALGLTLDLPLDRKAERNAYRSAQIALDQIRRDLSRELDVVERDILNQLRELTQDEKRMQIQRGQIEADRRAVAVTRIRYEAGNVDNRALLEARQGLTDAQNTLIDLKVRHFVARLRLRRDVGILFIDEKGRW